MKLNFIRDYSKGVMAILFLVLSIGIQNKAMAQFPASSYGFTAVSGTYTNLVGGTTFTAVQSDDVCPAATIPLGFTFNFCGLDYTTVRVGSNGYLTFIPTGGSTAFNDVTSFGTIKPALFWLWDDLDGATGAATYTTTGTLPNRVFTFQFKNWEWNWSTTGPNVSVQVKLYETTNVIEYVYNQEAQPGNPLGSGGASIGIVDGTTTPTFLSLNNATATPTASSTTFTAAIGTKPASGQIYRFTPPANCSVQTGFPVSATTTVTPANVCVSQNVTLSFNPITPMPPTVGLSYQWQSATAAGGPWTNVATSTTPTYTTTVPVSTPLFFRCQLLCNTSSVLLTTPASTQVVINNPGTPTTTPGSRCGPGTVNLTATPSAGNTIRWFNNLTQTIPISTNNTYSTPYLTQNTTYYTATVANANLALYNVGLPNFIQTNNFITATSGWGVRFNVTSACNVDSVGVYPIGTGTIQMRIWDANTQAVVYTGPVSPTITGTGTTKSMIYVGATALPVGSYVMGIAAFTGLTNLHNEGFNTVAYPFTSPVLNITAGSQGFGGTGTTAVYYFSYDWRVSAIGGCEGPRVPVVATINSSPVITKTVPAVVCNNSSASIVLTPPTPAYSTYNWTPVTNLFTNVAGTTPYVAGTSATTVYLKTTNVGTQTVYLMAGDPTIPTGCTYADTVKIWVQPTNVAINGNPDTICFSGNTVLKLDTIAGYYPNSIQWQTSTNGVNYTNITGATSSTYTTPLLNYGQNTYYRPLITAGATVCQNPVKYIVIANPTLVSASDSFNCGPGTVTLSAVTAGNGSPVWYTAPTGGAPIASGSPFVTPYLGTTTPYYVASRGGGIAGSANTSAGGTTSSGTTVTPLPSGAGGAKYQYLILASELQAMGFPLNTNLTALGINVVSASTTPYQGFAISLKNTTTTALTTTYEAGATQVYGPTNTTATAGINTFNFTTPFVWDGVSNLLVQTCWSNNATSATASTVSCDNTTFVSTHKGQQNSQNASTVCGLTGTAPTNNTTYSQRPKFVLTFNNKCESPRQQVIAHIYPIPVVDLGPDVNNCLDSGAHYILNAGVQPNNPTFLWDDSSSSQIRAVSKSDQYYVKVTNQYTCSSSDTINVIIRNNPVIELGNDTTVCNGVTLTLNPGNTGIQYFWSTGQVTSTINVNSAGSYNVFVTNGSGCTSADTIHVSMQGELPTIQGIQVSNNGNYTFLFTAVNPQNVIGYDWDFGDNSPHSYSETPTHTYDTNGNFTVVLHLSSTCGFNVDTLGAHIVGIHQINVSNNELNVYPNPTANIANIAVNGELKMEKIEVYNMLGQIIYKKNADSYTKHKLDLGAFASGVYTIQVYTDKGTVARKLEVLR